MEFAECVVELVFREDRLEETFKDDVDEAPVEPRMLEHVEDEHHALSRCFGANQMPKLLYKKFRKKITWCQLTNTVNCLLCMQNQTLLL